MQIATSGLRLPPTAPPVTPAARLRGGDAGSPTSTEGWSLDDSQLPDGFFPASRPGAQAKLRVPCPRDRLEGTIAHQ